MNQYALETPEVFDSKALLEVLPHRSPFLLLDKIVELDVEAKTIVGQKNVTSNEPFFAGHFPGEPIMPGVLVLEALAQTGGVLFHVQGYFSGSARFLAMNNVKFRRPVRPGDVLFLYCEGLFLGSKGGRLKTKATVRSKIAVEAEMSFWFEKRG